MARPASSLAGTGKVMPSGSQLVSTIGDDRDAEALGLLDRELLLVGVDDEDQVGRAAHVLDAAERAARASRFSRASMQALLLGEALAAAGEDLVDLAQARDRARDGLPVGQHAAEPAGVDVVLGRALGGIGDRVGGLALGADEQHAAAAWRPCRSPPAARGAASAPSGRGR